MIFPRLNDAHSRSKSDRLLTRSLSQGVSQTVEVRAGLKVVFSPNVRRSMIGTHRRRSVNVSGLFPVEGVGLCR